MHGLIGDQQWLHPQALQPPLVGKWQRFEFCPRGSVPFPHDVAQLQILRFISRPRGMADGGTSLQSQDAATGERQKAWLFGELLERKKAMDGTFHGQHGQHERKAEFMS